MSFDHFDNDSLVLRLSCSDELLQLHNRIVDIVSNYANITFDTIKRKYFGDNYSLHITISKSSSKFDVSSKELICRKDKIAKYFLAKKIDGFWEEMMIKNKGY